MIIAVPKERRPFEYRVGLSPAGVEMLIKDGHTVYVEHDAGLGAGFADQEFELAGARIAYSVEEVFGRADLILKITRPLQEEVDWIQPGKAVAGFLHLASTRQDRIDSLLAKKITAIAWEQVRLMDGSLPVLRPLSQIGGMMSAQIAARLLQNNWGGKGILLGGIAGVPPAEVVIFGAGTLGLNAARSFIGLGAHVTLLDVDIRALQKAVELFPAVVTMLASQRNIERVCQYADVAIGAIRAAGGRTPIIVSREMVKSMKPRALVMDLSIDEGGCFETSRPTTHDQPTYEAEGILHFCVPNIPGVAGRTSTYAFMNVAMPYILELANKGIEKAIADNDVLANAINTHNGELRNLIRLSDMGKHHGVE